MLFSVLDSCEIGENLDGIIAIMYIVWHSMYVELNQMAWLYGYYLFTYVKIAHTKLLNFVYAILCGKGDSLTKGTHRCFYGHIKVFLKTLIKI